MDYGLWRPEEKLKYLAYFPKNVATILDVGCGQGELLYTLKNKGFNVQGCDTDELCIKEAQHVIKDVRYADIERLSEYYPSRSFDLLTCLHVLEHCHSPYTALNETKIVTKRYALFAVPNARHIAHNERDMHLYSWNEKTFRNILESVGFNILKLSEDWINVIPNVLRIAPVLNRVLLRAFWEPIELVAIVQK